MTKGLRIYVPREGNRVAALSGDGNGQLVTAPVRKERVRKSKKELEAEAAKVLKQVDKVNSVPRGADLPPDRFYTLPTRKPKPPNYPSASLDRKWSRKSNLDLTALPPKKPQRTFSYQKPPKTSLLDLFRKPKKSNLKRSASDASTLKSKKPPEPPKLSPIIEATPREDYFEKSVTEQLKEYIDEVDDAIYQDSKKRKDFDVVVIDVDKAEQISGKRSKLRSSFKRLKNIINSPEMVHSSQRPVEKPPLTKGRTVDLMVRRLNNDKSPPPPKHNVMVAPNVTVQHNNNQPFSYTRGLSPEKESPTRPIIYAQVVQNGTSKQTIHTAYKKNSNSDSDEGLGIEDLGKKPQQNLTHFGDNVESPILPKYRSNYYIDSSTRGRADGMDAKRQSLTEDLEDTPRQDISARRDLLESRINEKITKNGTLTRFNRTPSPKGHSPKKNIYKSSPDIYQYNSLSRQEIRRSDRDKLGDSGIENDRRDSGDNFRRKYRDFNESEDEGFASSLLIASERQHAEEGGKRQGRREYDSEDDGYRNFGEEFAPRERSIDDGSHFDPRIDKEFQKAKVEKKPPKPEKKSSLEKVKQLFKKKKDKPGMVREESLRARYKEYKGSREDLDKRGQDEPDYRNRRRLSTPSPSPSPTRELKNNEKNQSVHGSWFKSLDRLSRKKDPTFLTRPPQDQKKNHYIREPEFRKNSPKNLRFFGDTDAEYSSDGARNSTTLKNRISHKDRLRSQSSRELHNITEEVPKPHRSMSNLKPPVSPARRSHEVPRDKSRRKKYEISSVESSTEGDSSQQSQKSIVYLHAATVGDIPGPGYKRAASREELASESSRIQPQVKTLSRSFSVLAPWRPRHPHEGAELDYSHQQKPKYEKNSGRKTATLKKKADSRKPSQNPARSKENLSNLSKGSSSTLYKKKERLPRENSRYEKRGPLSKSTESLDRRGNREVSRSVSMPKDHDKSAGWFKMTKKNHHRSEYRL